MTIPAPTQKPVAVRVIPATVQKELQELLAPAVTAAGYDLEAVSVTVAGRRNLVRVIVDGDDGVDLDAVASVARSVSEVLDEDLRAELLLPGAYVLEVSSPGVDRPLTEPRHWRRARGRLVSVLAAGQKVEGRITATDDDGVQISTPAGGANHPWSALGPGKVTVEFSHNDTDGPDDLEGPDGPEDPEDPEGPEDPDGHENEPATDDEQED